MPSVVGREARFQRGEIFFLSWKKKKSVAVLLFSTFGKVSNMPDVQYFDAVTSD